MKNQESRAEIILGVDTHLDVHVGAVIAATGRVLGTLSVGTHNEGYKQLLCRAQTFGLLRRAGVEGTGFYGAALTHVLQSNGVKAIEINRPDRTRRRGRCKSDATDAECAARAVLAGDATSIPKIHNGAAEGAAYFEPGTPQRSQGKGPNHQSNKGVAGQCTSGDPRCCL